MSVRVFAMGCKEAEKLIDACLLEGKDPAENDRLCVHLENCARCSRQLAEGRKLLEILRPTLTSIEVPEGIEQQVLSALESSSRPQRAARAPRRPAWRTILVRGGLGLTTGLALAFVVHIWQKGPVPTTVQKQPVAEVKRVSGDVQFKRADSPQWGSLPAGGALFVGDRVRTGNLGSLEASLQEGGTLRANAGCIFSILSPKELSIDSGELSLEVSTNEPPFAVAFATGRAKVLEGKFKVKVVPGASLPVPGKPQVPMASRQRQYSLRQPQVGSAAIGWLEDW